MPNRSIWSTYRKQCNKSFVELGGVVGDVPLWCCDGASHEFEIMNGDVSL